MDAKQILFIMDWAVKFPPNTTKFGRAWYNPKVFEYDNRVDFMKSVINYFEQRRINSFGGPTFGAKYNIRHGRWEENVHSVPMGRRRSVDGQRGDTSTFELPQCTQDQSGVDFEDGMVERDEYWKLCIGTQSTSRVFY